MATGSTIVHGLPYPEATDAPNVHTDIQALAQALANSLTSPVPVGASGVLVDGELAVSTAAPITLTLPSAAANVKCGVFAKIATGSNPVTVTTAGGAVIYGRGLGSGVSSITLGTVGAFVVLQSDGTSWHMVAGEQDTGWLALTITNGGSNLAGAYAPACILRGDTVEMRGGGTQTTGGTLLTLPSGFRPADQVIAAIHNAQNTPTIGTCTVSTSGTVAIAGGGSAQPFHLDGVRFQVI